VDDQDYGSEPMSLSPLLGSIAGLRPYDMSSPVTRQFENNTRLSDDISWADMPVNDDIGDIPEFPTQQQPADPLLHLQHGESHQNSKENL
jgi:hypothetical protein